MQQAIPMKQKASTLRKIVGPILITQLALFLMTFFDVLMTGRYGQIDLAGVAIGSALWTPVFTGFAGILTGLTPIIAHYIGGKKHDAVRPSVQQGLYVSLALSVIVAIFIFLLVPSILNNMSLDAAVRPIAFHYLVGMAVGLLPLFAYSTLRAFFDALGATRVSMFIVLLSAPINIILNYALIYGKFGLPELGGIGAGYASGITYWIVFSVAFFIAKLRKPFERYMLFHAWARPQIKEAMHLLRIGVPIGLAIFIETRIFAALTLLMSHTYSTSIISSHQVAMNFTSLLYMIPLSISMGATIVVGQSVGAKQFIDAKQYSFLSIGFALFFSILSMTVIFLFREPIAALYSNEPEIIALAAKFLIFGAFFQWSDAFLAPIQGALRGYKDVNSTFITAIISFWVIGLPVGYALATWTDLGPYGYWIGLIIGLNLGAIALLIRLLFIQKQIKKEVFTHV